jgi:hypothetical protein
MFKFVNKSKYPDDEFMNLAQGLYATAKSELEFSQDPTVILLDDPENASNPLGKTAYYNPESHQITLYMTNRHIKDVLRSFTHELVHHTQNCNGNLSDVHAEDGYAQDNPHLRDMEKDAYLRGNMTFRDWEDRTKRSRKGNLTEKYQFKSLVKMGYNPKYLEEII